MEGAKPRTGEDIGRLADEQPAATLSFVQVATISRAALFELAADYPDALAHIQRCSRRLTLRLALLKAYRYWKAGVPLGAAPPRQERRNSLVQAYQVRRPVLLCSASAITA